MVAGLTHLTDVVIVSTVNALARGSISHKFPKSSGVADHATGSSTGCANLTGVVARKTILVGGWTVIAIETDAVRTAEFVDIFGGVEHSVSCDVAGETRFGVETDKAGSIAVVALLVSTVIPEYIHAGTEASSSVDSPCFSGIARSAACWFDACKASIMTRKTQLH